MEEERRMSEGGRERREERTRGPAVVVSERA
jgi:hypothetical protein